MARRSASMGLLITTLYADGQSTIIKEARNVLFVGAVLDVTGSLIDPVGASPFPEKP